MRTSLGRIERLTGIFVLASLAVLAGVLFASAQRSGLSGVLKEPFVLEVRVEKGAGAVPGSPVRLYDVPVGTVTRVEVDPEPEYPGKPVRLRCEIDPAMVRFLRGKTQAVLETGMPPALPGVIRLEPAGEGTLENRATLVGKVEHSLVTGLLVNSDAMTREAQVMLKQFERVLTRFDEVMKKFESGESLAARLMNDPEFASDVKSTFDHADALSAEAAALVKPLRAAVEHAPGIGRNVGTLSEQAIALVGNAQTDMESLRKLLSSMERSLGLMNEVLISVKSATHYAPELVRKADTSLEESQRLIEGMQRNVLVRGTLPPTAPRRTGAVVRPAPAPAASATP
jgi:ABC-type transporter Mla subunit MlaD